MFGPEAIVRNGKLIYLDNLSKIQHVLEPSVTSYLMLMDSNDEAMETIGALLDEQLATKGEITQELDWLYSTLNSNT